MAGSAWEFSAQSDAAVPRQPKAAVTGRAIQETSKTFFSAKTPNSKSLTDLQKSRRDARNAAVSYWHFWHGNLGNPEKCRPPGSAFTGPPPPKSGGIVYRRLTRTPAIEPLPAEIDNDCRRDYLNARISVQPPLLYQTQAVLRAMHGVVIAQRTAPAPSAEGSSPARRRVFLW